MYAVIKTGGKQHKVQVGDELSVELLEGEPGDKVTFEPILVVEDGGATHVGKGLGGSKVTALLLGEVKADKIQVFKYKPKTGYTRKTGHRQQLTRLQIEAIDFKKKAAPAKKAAEKPAEKPKEEAAAE